MGYVNQLEYLKRVMPAVTGPVVETGSKDYGNTSSFRDFYAGSEYIGVDMEAGKGVDFIVDLTAGVGDLRTNYFALGICCSVLEHVRRPWIFAEHLTSVIRDHGALYIRCHGCGAITPIRTTITASRGAASWSCSRVSTGRTSAIRPA